MDKQVENTKSEPTGIRKSDKKMSFRKMRSKKTAENSFRPPVTSTPAKKPTKESPKDQQHDITIKLPDPTTWLKSQTIQPIITLRDPSGKVTNVPTSAIPLPAGWDRGLKKQLTRRKRGPRKPKSQRGNRSSDDHKSRSPKRPGPERGSKPKPKVSRSPQRRSLSFEEKRPPSPEKMRPKSPPARAASPPKMRLPGASSSTVSRIPRPIYRSRIPTKVNQRSPSSGRSPIRPVSPVRLTRRPMEMPKDVQEYREIPSRVELKRPDCLRSPKVDADRIAPLPGTKRTFANVKSKIDSSCPESFRQRLAASKRQP